MSGPEPISPELALVAPDLAEAARRSLPDRPWETFAPPRPRPVLRVAVLAPEPAAPGPPEPQPRRPRRWSVGTGRVALTAAVALLVVSCFLPPRDAPRLVAAPPQPNSPPAGRDVGPLRVPVVPDRICVTRTDGQRDPFRPICPPVRR